MQQKTENMKKKKELKQKTFSYLTQHKTLMNLGAGAELLALVRSV